MDMLRCMTVLIMILIGLINADPKEIKNVEFTDDEGITYDLFELLDRGTHVYIELVDNK